MADRDSRRSDEKPSRIVDVWLDEDTLAYYARRAETAGRTLEAQIVYELQVNHELIVPDPGDVEATQRGQVFRRMRSGSILQG
jgi:hypothetical protein